MQDNWILTASLVGYCSPRMFKAVSKVKPWRSFQGKTTYPWHAFVHVTFFNVIKGAFTTTGSSICWFECGMFVMLQAKVCLQKGSFCFLRGKLPQIFVTLILVEPLARRNQRSPSHLRTLFCMFTTLGLEEDRGKMICYYCLFSRLYLELFYPVIGIIVSHCKL